MENQKNDNLNMLEAIVQNTEMGKNTLDQLVPMAEDEQFKAELLRQRNIYRQLNQEAHAAIDACGGSAQGQSAMAKLNTKVSIGHHRQIHPQPRRDAHPGQRHGRGGLHQIPEGLPGRRAGVEEADAEAAGF